MQELGQLITNDTQREIFPAISTGEPISRVAVRQNMTYQETMEAYSNILKN
ncbi:hypothetical protein SFC43_14470 [Bacteroides sp. CR5/BHMF/2]|nr:hypothetical protein [Bacteroides sp. CR5/BHMF/2]